MARILVVDDSFSTRSKLKTMLTMLGHDIVGEATNGLQAYREFEKHQPDLVTMDITMPIIDGITALKRILEVFPDANIVMVSSLAQKHLILNALESGAKHYIIKPIDPDNLSKVVSKVLEESKNPKCSPKPSSSKNEASAEEQPALKTDVVDSLPPFSIENKSGVFIVNLSPRITLDNLFFLNSAVQGLLFVKPLVVVFNFEKIEHLEADVLENLALIMEYILKASGTLNIVSTSKAIVDFMKKKNLGRWDNIFSNLTELFM
ncbi:MAG: response regulator [Clostridia bacterium]|nr:response regulator [Clostridia bacterium]